MTDREKLIELIEENDRRCCGAICEVCSYTKEGEVCQSAMLADHLIANGVTVQKWIPVSDKSHKVPKGRIFVANEKDVAIARSSWLYKTASGEIRCPMNYGAGMTVTHWMPLPEPPPKEVRGNA